MASTVHRRAVLVVSTAAAAALALTGCARSESQNSAPAGGGPAASAAPSQAAGPTCSIDQTGYPKVDPKSAVIGFSQSEKEDNPFRIAETQSIKDQASKLGVAADHMLTTNAQNDLNKQISDIKSLLDRGVQLLIVA